MTDEATLTVWRFTKADAAAQTEHTLLRARKQEPASIHDAAILSWPDGARAPAIRQLHSLTGARSLVDTFWSLLLGTAFLAPLLTPTDRPNHDALSAIGIDAQFIKHLRQHVTPGSSALFVLTPDAHGDQLRAAFSGLELAQPIHTNLSHTQAHRLHDVFGSPGLEG
jgi:uncharacterized membrane protein